MREKKMLVLLMMLALGGMLAACGDGGGKHEDADADADVPTDDVQPDDVQPDDVQPDDVQPDDVQPDDVQPDDAVEEDVVEEDAPATAQVSGRVWLYVPSVGTYATNPQSGATVIAEAASLTPVADYTVTTANAGCDTWWSSGTPFDCGEFLIDDIPHGTQMILRARHTETTYPETLSRIFNVDDAGHEVLVLVDPELITGLMTAWGYTLNAEDGCVVGLLVRNVNPDPVYEPTGTDTCPGDETKCELYGFVGNATVAVEPMPDCLDCMQTVYFDSADYTSTARTSTDPAQSLFFIANVPPLGVSEPYTLTVTSGTDSFAPVTFAVEAGNITYLLILPVPGD
jgi:hypothetical protein